MGEFLPMKKKVTIVKNPIDAATWKDFDVDDIAAFLVDHFGVWPDGAHIYLNYVSKSTDITPFDVQGIERLRKISTGHFFIVIYPEGLEVILLVTAIVVAAVSITLSFLFRPSPNTKSQQQASPNNQLADRQNVARPNQRIPDIYGQLWATFDLLAVPYRTFVSNTEFEHCFMCIGRGSYDLDHSNVRDNITPLEKIDGASARVFGPGANPNNGGAEQFHIGTVLITEQVLNIQVFDSVNGQLLQAPNLSAWLSGVSPFGSNNLKFRSPNIIENNASIGWQAGFQAGDNLNLGGLVANDANASDPGAVHATVDLTGIYPIASVSATQIALSSPSTINPNWSALAAFTGAVSNGMNDNMLANNSFWVGKFFIARPDVTQVICNFVAEQGSYKVRTQNGTTAVPNGTQVEVDTTIVVGITPCDASGTPTGAEVTTTGTLIGSHVDRLIKGLTITINVTPGTGGFLIRARRSGLTDISGDFSVSDGVQWRDCYIVSALGTIDFGNITTIQTLIKATPQATAIKDRKLNGLVTRKVPAYTGGTTFGALTASTNAADIICAIALDPFIGRRTISEIDVVQIYSVAGPGGQIQAYFNVFSDNSIPTQFCYTFDDSKVSFEETIFDIATVIFCQAFRRGSKLQLSFEKQTNQSVLLFNHRNKIPKTETRSLSFGMVNDNDGIELTYTEPNAPNYPNQDTQVTLYFPPDKSAVNAKKIDTIGIRNVQQAMLYGWRLFNKLLYQNLSIQFDSTEETALLVIQDRILVADNTRSDTQDGEVLSVAALVLTLSQNVIFASGVNYTIFLQLSDGTVEAIPITAGSAANKVVLSSAPSVPLETDVDNYAKTTYVIISDLPTPSIACLLSEKQPKDRKTFEVKAVNYEDAYYDHDNLYKTDLDVAQLTLEVVQDAVPSNADIAQLTLEVVTS
jgi:hypothetical protein